MGPVVRLLQAIRSLTKSGAIKTMDDAYRLAQRELGERFNQFQNQIKDAFNQGQKEITKITNKPTADIIPFRKKEGIESLSKGRVKDKGEVLDVSFKPGVDKRGKRVEESPSQASGTIMDRISKASNRIEELMKEQEAMYKPKQGLQLAEGLTRTIARKILDRKNIEIPPGRDPIEVFSDVFGESISDVNNLAEELIEIDQRGGGLKNIDKMIEMEGLFDIEIPKNPQRGLTDEEMLKLKKEVDQEKMLDEFDPTDRTENSYGGINRIGYADGPEDPKNKKGIMKVIKKIPKVGKAVEGAAGIIKFIKTLEPIEAMKEVNKVIAKDGPYKNVSDKDTDKIFKDTQDHIFERDVKPSEFDVNFDDEVDVTKVPGSKPIKQGDEITSENFGESQFAPDTSGLEKARELAPKMAERFELKRKYPGIDDDLLTAIIDDPDPNNKAQVLGTLEQLMELQRQGKSPEEAVDIIKQTMFKGRRDNSKGGLQYLMGL